MAKTQYLEYSVHLTDAAQVESLNTQYPKGLNRAPYNPGPPEGGAAVEFAPSYPPALPVLNVGTAFVAPSLKSPWFSSDNDFPRNVATFTRSNWFIRIITFGFGGSTKFYWIARFVFSPAVSVLGANEEHARIPQRRWVDGFELPDYGGGASGNAGNLVSRAASRVIDGFGFAYRSAANLTFQQPPSAATWDGIWERLYLRPRTLDSGEIWRGRVQAVSGAGFSLYVTATGQLAVYRNPDATTTALIGMAGSLALDTWYRLDLILHFKPDVGTPPNQHLGTLKVYLDGALLISATMTFGGSTALVKHNYSTLGNSRTTPTTKLEVDLDDWIGAAIPFDKDPSVPVWEDAHAYSVDSYVQKAGVYRCLAAHTSNATNAPPASAYWKRVLESVDWVNGSHAQLVRPTGFGTGHASWTGNFRLLLQRVVPSAAPGLTSTTALAPLRVTTDALVSLGELPDILGWAAFGVGLYSQRGTTSGKLGYKIGAAAPVLVNITQLATPAWNTVLYAPSGLAQPEVVAALELHHEKGNDVGSSTVRALQAQAEMIGIFGAEDVPPDSTVQVLPPPAGVHNAPYPRSPWARAGLPPLSPVRIKSGTYVGNGVGLDLEFAAPLHFLWVRPLTGDSGGTRWFSSLLASHTDDDEGPRPELSPDQLQDLTFTLTNAFLVRFGSHAQVNANGVTYQYIAFMDPGARFLLCGAFSHGPTGGSASYPYANALLSTGWTPVFGFLWGELGPGTTTTSRLYVKGPGHAASGASLILSGTPVADSFTFAEGLITQGAGAFGATLLSQVGYAVWRSTEVNIKAYFFELVSDTPNYSTAKLAAIEPTLNTYGVTLQRNSAGEIRGRLYLADGSVVDVVPDGGVGPWVWIVREGTGGASTQSDVFATGSYVGDGAAARTITLASVSSRRPLWAIVQPHNAIAEVRDPSHTTTGSSSVAGAAHASGYIESGAVNAFSVGVSLNASGVTYTYFVLWGCTEAGNGGWSVQCEFEPVLSDSPTDWPPPPGGDGPPTGEDEPTPPIILPEEPDWDCTTVLPDTDLGCCRFTLRLVNLALSRIGVSKQIVIDANDQIDNTEEAAVAMLTVKCDVATTLRDFPWPFATKYATLALVSGSVTAPANPDWTYAYRRPGDCIFERRIVVARGAAANPPSPPFALSRDSGGGIIFCNEASAKLEYTSRTQCAPYEGDELFKDAVAWRIAMSLAAPLTRMREKEDYARQMYDAAIRRAYEVLRPGNPGPRATGGTDPDAATDATAANLTVVNRALVRIGASTIAALTDQGREATEARLVFEDELKATLRDHPWAFATRYATLVFVGGTVAAPVNADWTFSYRLPTDCVFARRLAKPGTGRKYDATPDPFRAGTDATGGLLFCDVLAVTPVPMLEYTARINAAVLRSDALFREALAWRLAAVLALSVGQQDPEAVEQLGRGADATAGQHQQAGPKQGRRLSRERIAAHAWQQYQAVLSKARTGDAREQQQTRGDEDADWILAR